jgi:hypothetical protein
MGCFGAGTSYRTAEEVAIQNVSVKKGPSLADAFHRQGAIAVVGLDSLVTLEFSDRVTLELIEALAVQRLTVRKATEEANLESGRDPVYKSQLIFYPEQNGGETLSIKPVQSMAQAVDMGPVVVLFSLELGHDQVCRPTRPPNRA